jgi:hypothetical protein
VRTTTEPKNWKFYFTITDLGRFLGKSPVTLRGWERKEFIHVPRDPSGDRKLTTKEINGIAKVAYKAGRISRRRRDMVCAAMTMIELIEAENIK